MRYKEQYFHCEDAEVLDHQPREMKALLSLKGFNTQLEKVPSSLNFYAILQMTMKETRRNCMYKKRSV